MAHRHGAPLWAGTTVRASLAPYNTYDDVDALVAALQRLRVTRS